ncbi:BZ3500_MvSof-1268-A1-R1_Chr1-3g01724 [Microbotryum saponariae]|uniref:BZ3500_MvSof-1268-A1-R1_Chr1-3g01724 protein n=1 Tax=Microbotryum saponariae TaxID=289078 RepID=A0A2X0MF98_9BASI|nr:BZ3500_MvSof-1268-A1-R1_Chr1-3g01724 [Microbotryum saponariae]SCZ94437.1 BZ3501_MvSof-1269-A2-R1_Chr1-3g01325 [Microbotryum saponariae]
MASSWKWKNCIPAILASGPSLLASAEERRTTAAAAEQNPRDVITNNFYSQDRALTGLQLFVSLDSSNGSPSSRTAVYLNALDLCESAFTQQILDWFIEHAANLNLDFIAPKPTVIDSSVLLSMYPLNIHLHLHFNLPLPSKASSPSSPSSEALREWLTSPTSVHLTVRPLITKMLPKLASVLVKQFPNDLNPRWAQRLANDRKSYSYLSKALNDIFLTFEPGSENWIDLQTVKRHLARLQEHTAVEDQFAGGGVIGGVMGLVARRYGNPDAWKAKSGMAKSKEGERRSNKELQGWDFPDRLLDGSDGELEQGQEEGEEQSFESILTDEDADPSDGILAEDLRSAGLADDDDEQMDSMDILDLFD